MNRPEPIPPTPRDAESLNDEQMDYVVRRLALFDSVTAVTNAMQEEFRVAPTREAVERCDPTSLAGRALAPQWANLFYETRAALLGNPAAIGIANKAVRLRWLHRIAERALEQGSNAEARAAIEQAAKEMGESYSKKHEQPGPGPISDGELDARIAVKAAELGLAPAGAARARTPDRGADAAPEPQPAEDPVSG